MNAMQILEWTTNSSGKILRDRETKMKFYTRVSKMLSKTRNLNVTK